MNEDLSELNLEDDFNEIIKDFEFAQNWKLHRPKPLEVWACMTPAPDLPEKFYPVLIWARYPGDPPSLKFLDPATQSLNQPKAWPQIRGFRPASMDACVNWCAEGFNLHPEWRSDPNFRWDSRGNVLLRTLRIMQMELDFHYSGRFKG